MTTRRTRRAVGFTLVEATAAVAVMAIAAAAIIMPFTAGAAHELEHGRRTLAAALASELMERIIALPFESDDGEIIADYDGYSEPIAPLVTGDGTVLEDPAAADMTRTASCQYVYVAGQDGGEPPNFIRVTVRVDHRGDEMVSISRLVYNRRAEES